LFEEISNCKKIQFLLIEIDKLCEDNIVAKSFYNNFFAFKKPDNHLQEIAKAVLLNKIQPSERKIVSTYFKEGVLNFTLPNYEIKNIITQIIQYSEIVFVKSDNEILVKILNKIKEKLNTTNNYKELLSIQPFEIPEIKQMYLNELLKYNSEFVRTVMCNILEHNFNTFNTNNKYSYVEYFKKYVVSNKAELGLNEELIIKKLHKCVLNNKTLQAASNILNNVSLVQMIKEYDVKEVLNELSKS